MVRISTKYYIMKITIFIAEMSATVGRLENVFLVVVGCLAIVFFIFWVASKT